MTPIARDSRHIPEHMPCECGHLGWRHEPNTGKCARCECVCYARPQDEPRPYLLSPRRETQRRVYRPPA